MLAAVPRHDPGRPGYEGCTGCNLCVLPCPVFRATNDLALTLRGRARAIQAGAGADEVRASLAACVTCGACEPVCPEDIDTVGWTLEWRTRLSAPLAAPIAWTPAESAIDARVALLAPGLDARTAERVARVLGATVATDCGEDLAHALEAGLPIDPRRHARFVESFAGVRELVVTDGRLHAALRRWLPEAKIRGLAERLLEVPRVRETLRKDDLLVLESRGYHADFSRQVLVWDTLRKGTGVQIALDLHRLAIATGTASLRATAGTFPLEEQARWLLEGRSIARVVAESEADAAVLRRVAGVPVVTVAGLL